MLIACLQIQRFAVEAERQRRPDVASRLILVGDAAVVDLYRALGSGRWHRQSY